MTTTHTRLPFAALLITAMAVAAGCSSEGPGGGASSMFKSQGVGIELEDGRFIEIPDDADLPKWAKETLYVTDARAVQNACENAYLNGREPHARVKALCQVTVRFSTFKVSPEYQAAVAVLANSITLDNGRTITIPEGIDPLRTKWAQQTFTAEEAERINAACHRATEKHRMETGQLDLPKPMHRLCLVASDPSRFKAK